MEERDLLTQLAATQEDSSEIKKASINQDPNQDGISLLLSTVNVDTGLYFQIFATSQFSITRQAHHSLLLCSVSCYTTLVSPIITSSGA